MVIGMYVYDVYNFENIIKEWINEINTKLKNIFTKKQNDEEIYLNFTKENQKIINFIKKSLIEDIHKTTDNIAYFIKSEYILADEYYDFKSIQHLINISINIENNETELRIVLNILKELIKITNLKFDLFNKAYNEYNSTNFKNMPNNLKEEFAKSYDDFKKFLANSKLEFYNTYNKESKNSKKYLELIKDEIK